MPNTYLVSVQPRQTPRFIPDWRAIVGIDTGGGKVVVRSMLATLLYRLYTEWFTPAGRWMVWMTMGMAAMGSFTLDIQVYVPFAYLFGIWWIAAMALPFCRPKVRFRAVHADRVCAGELLPVEVEVERAGGVRTEMFVVPHRLPAGIEPGEEGGARVRPLGKGEKIRLRTSLRCSKRGVYRLTGYRVVTDFPFGVLMARRVFPEPRTLLVYPPFTRLIRLDIGTGRRYQPGGVALASILGDSFEYLGNREFREGDSVRDIDWRATARLQNLIVREYREEYFLRVAVILDTHVPRRARAAQKATFERAVSVCAAVSDYMARQEYLVDLFAAGPDLYHLTSGRSLAYLDQILDILACVESSATEPFEVIEPEIMETMAQLTTVICVMLDWNETRRAFVRRLQEQGVGVKVIVVREGACALDPEEEAGTLGLIPVIDAKAFAAGVEEL